MFDLKWNHIFYKAGSKEPDPEKPTLVFIHGAGGSSVLWDNQVDQFAGCANTISLDLPAHGDSLGEPEKTLSGYADVVDGFIDALKLPNPVPCGLSMGGAIAQIMLAEYPAKYRAGVLISTGARLKVHPMVLETVKKDYKSFVLLLKDFAAYKNTSYEKIKPIFDAAELENPDTAVNDFEACNDFDIEADQPDQKHLADITAPVLVITAMEDSLTPPKYGDFLIENIPNSTLVRIEGAGHMVPAEKPEETNSAIAEFLNNLFK